MTLTTTGDLKQLGTILSVWAHPDDETFAMGGIMAAAAQNGQQVICVTATRGEWGVQDESRWPQERLGDIRAAELRTALDILGVETQYFLGYIDGTCQEVDENKAADKIATLIERYQPDSIMTFGPDGLTGHADHQTVSRWTGLAARKAGSEATLYHVSLTPEQLVGFRDADKALNFFFNIPTPAVREESETAICLHLTEELFEKKMAALRAMPSQYEKMFELFDGKLRGGFGIEAFIEIK